KMSEAKSFENGNPAPRPASTRREITSIDSEHNVIKECPATPPAFVRYGCLGCQNTYPVAGHCLFGNEIGDEFCQRDRKLNTRATSECLQKGCISAMYVENRTLVCTHSGKCECIDRFDNSYGDIQKTRSVAEIIDAELIQGSNRIAALQKQFPRRHPSGAIITEVPVS
ncbi:hypothetical protein, partial [Methanoregula sp.]|uniref:hypothetical protein n=1 Tax=Methanoregula sp. TaxID=2052170 RepID=UPI000CAF74D4